MARVQGRVKLDMVIVIYMQADRGIRDLLGRVRGITIMSSTTVIMSSKVSQSGKTGIQAAGRRVFKG